LSVGAGHEAVLYWLANRTRYVVATDMYGGVWQSHGAREGDETVLADPRQYAPFPYREDHLVFLKMDGTALAFADGTFDVVYSLSSIEHFGGLEGASRAVAEMARVLKPGGVVTLATEYLLEGPPHHEAFTPAQVRLLLQHPDLGWSSRGGRTRVERYACRRSSARESAADAAWSTDNSSESSRR
jgi:SAM-dependent methyltransferase